MHVTDWFPTFVKLAGGNVDDIVLDGYDAWDSISNGGPVQRTELLHNIDPVVVRRGVSTSTVFDTTVSAAIRVGDWKLLTGDPAQGAVDGAGSWIAMPEDPFHQSVPNTDPDTKNLWLFNIANDPLEQHEVSERFPHVVDMMLRKLAGYNQTAVPARWPFDDPQCDPALHGGALTWWR